MYPKVASTEQAQVNFESLANEHKDAIYRQMLRVCGNREDAEDVLIEALLKAYTSLDQLRDSASFRAWLAQIARRVCWQLKQQEALLPLLQLSEMEAAGNELQSTTAAPEEIVSAAQMKQMLQEAVAQLPPEFRAVYQLRDLDELPGDEVAAMLGISIAAMKSRLHRARSMLREHIDAAMLGNPPRTK
jgi:RNA polymerase sigma-70 factor (ECF subfamily)